MRDFTEHPNREIEVIVSQVEFEQSMHSELDQSWPQLTYTAHSSHQHETDHMAISQAFLQVLHFPFTSKRQPS